eukprot:TRINITY_DN5410_c0_g1_i1.p1 TRINITY_DN5410_c0_g1~~TRINITY_DN5410_c0_g1_i1.p1  ORF type:complete len:259 (+),score=36.99 TRINITY_DN5410_c0_g1_i1:343-1119(+)
MVKPKAFIYQLEAVPGAARYTYTGSIHLQTNSRPNTFASSLETYLRTQEAVTAVASITAERSTVSGDLAPTVTYRLPSHRRVGGPWADQDVYLGQDLPRVLLPYQEQLKEYMLGPVSPREILWLVDEHGNSGKSIFAKYMAYYHDCMTFSSGDTGGLLNMVYKHKTSRCYILDLSHTKPKTLSSEDLYSAIEDIKDGYIVDTKYGTGSKQFAPPHVVVFANTPPNNGCLTKDRWTMQHIDPAWNTYAHAQPQRFEWRE